MTTTSRSSSHARASVSDPELVLDRRARAGSLSSAAAGAGRRRLVAGAAGRAASLIRSARISTCCFSSDTLVSRRPLAGLEEEGALPGGPDGAGDEPVRRVEVVHGHDDTT